MFKLLLILCNILLAASNPGNYQDYDMYTFSVQWGPTQCLGVNTKLRDENKVTCQDLLLQIPKHKVSIHGLWPGLQSGARLQDCNQGEEIKIISDDSPLFETMRKYWPTLNTKNDNEYFWGHEYNKHGFCYSEFIGNYDYREYFSKTLEVFFDYNLDDLIRNVFEDRTKGEYKFPYDEFLERMDTYFGGRKYGITCKKYNEKFYISEIRLNLDLNFELLDKAGTNTCKKGADIYILYN